MNQLKTNLKLSAALLLVGFISGCATTPNPDLERAQKLFDEINADPLVAAKAPVPHVEAEESLAQLKYMVEEGEDEEDIKRVADETVLRTKIAREKTNTVIAREAIAKAEAERKQVQIDARTSEADTARARASHLARELAELKAKPSDLSVQTTERGIVVTMGGVLFEYDKANVNAGGMRVINKVATFLEQYPERTLRIEGHTDSKGSDEYNQRLSERRADAVKRALMYAGVKPERMSTMGYGEAYPIATNATSSGRQQNRRVEIIISDDSGVVRER